MPSSSDTGVSDTLDPMAVVSDDEIPSEREVYTSDTTSTDDDDFQPFALPDVGVEPADGLPAGDLQLAVIPAPIPLAAFPVVDMPIDVVSDDDIDLFEEDPPEADHEGGPPIVADVILPIAEAPAEELPADSPVPDSFESVASASLHTQGVQHHSSDADPDMALSAAPGPAHDFEFDHEVDDDFDPVFPPDFDPDQEIEFIHLDQPLEAPVDPIDPLFDIPADFDMDLVDPEPVVAPEPVAAPDPALEHDPVHDDAPAIAPLVDDIPIADPPVVAPPLVDDPVVDAPIPDPVPDILPPHLGEGSSRQLPVPAPPMMSSPFPFTSQFPHVAPPTAPSFMPSSEPFLWTTPPIMPLSDPYHPYHVGYSTEDILTSVMIQKDALTRRIQELERAPRPPCHCQTPFAAPHAPRPLSPDSDVRFLTSEQQIAYLLRVCHALEEDWLHMHRLYYSRFPPPPPPPSA
ncbi:hypothetical protein HanIR_Chr10g0488811 [Helianthus annuus]|nr:hypothetical protein HanIR_Chr10g0488811 [Helianthus annuus]